MSGYEATQQIRQLIHENSLDQPIISAVTGHSEQSYIDLAIESGMNQVLSKPIKAELLKDLLLRLDYPIELAVPEAQKIKKRFEF